MDGAMAEQEEEKVYESSRQMFPQRPDRGHPNRPMMRTTTTSDFSNVQERRVREKVEGELELRGEEK